jgi:hypothetical protein
MSFSEARLLTGVIRKNGTARKPRMDVKMSFRRERLTDSIRSWDSFVGKDMAFVGQIELQVKQ